MTIKEYLGEKAADIASIKVIVSEMEMQEHPPGFSSWHYHQDTEMEGFNFPRRSYDQTSFQTVGFDLSSPVLRTLRLREEGNCESISHEGNLPTYWNAKGHSITRRFECTITFVQGSSSTDSHPNSD